MKTIKKESGYYEFEKNGNLFIVEKSNNEWLFSVKEVGEDFYTRMENSKSLKDAKKSIENWD